ISLATGNFKLLSRFLTDRIGDDRLKIRTKTETRRYYGNSKSNLPLFEEDNQKNVFELDYGQTIVLLPFGRNTDNETLKIEITPTVLASTGPVIDDLKINFEKQLTSGEINIEAFKVPHRFVIDAVLSADGHEIAKSSAPALLEEETNIALETTDKSTG